MLRVSLGVCTEVNSRRAGGHADAGGGGAGDAGGARAGDGGAPHRALLRVLRKSLSLLRVCLGYA